MKVYTVWITHSISNSTETIKGKKKERKTQYNMNTSEPFQTYARIATEHMQASYP